MTAITRTLEGGGREREKVREGGKKTYLDTKLANRVSDLYSGNYKTLMKESKENLN
jgi:hypothetical protein